MKKRWDELLEDSSSRKLNLQRKALKNADEKDWANYEGALIRDGEISRSLRLLAGRASLEHMDIVRKLIGQVETVPGKELMASGMVDGVPTTWLVLKVTGNNLRVRKRIAISLMGSRWDTMIKLLNKDTVTNLKFHIADMRPEDMPRSSSTKKDISTI
ncbi:MAG: hypothetical protein ACXABY_11450 [Candidatus Thorarchaeota archaeon]|jgi:hypothetical protein